MSSDDPTRRALDQQLLIGDPETLYEQAPCGYLSVHPDGQILKANRTFLTWTRRSDGDLAGTRFVDLLAPGARIFHETHYQPLLHLQGHVDELALDMLRADGTRFPVLVNAVLDRDSDGDPQLVRVAIFDATERRRYEQELLAARKRAEESEATATRIARTLQETLMPPRSPSIPGLEIATAFRPAGTGTEIGGDFYDVFQRSDHDWIISMGDVAGKGVEAAVVANLARFTLRGLAVSETSPASMLTDLNQVIFNHSRDRFCTVALIRLHQHDGAWHVTLGMGGHPVPLVINQAVDTEALNKPSFLVGAFEEAVFADRSFLLEPGATLMLYTDGVTEARRGNDDFYGEDRLRDLVRETALDPDQLVAAVLTDVLDFQNEYAKDDIALIAVRRPPART